MRRYVLTPEAAADLREIRDYVLEQGSPRAARYVVSAIISACRSIALTPGQAQALREYTVGLRTQIRQLQDRVIGLRAYIDAIPRTTGH